MKNAKKHIIISAFTIAVITVLILAGPAAAINVGINNLLGAYKQGDKIDFSVTVDINKDKTGELLPIEYTDVTITNPDGTTDTCKIINNKVEGCGFLSISSITKSNDLGYGYGYGYGYDGNAGKNLGYGYGYGYGSSSGNVIYNLVLDTTEKAKGEYSAKAIVYAGTANTPFSSSAVSFNVWTAPAAGNTAVTASLTSTTPAIVDATADADTSITINANASATGSVTVSKYTENIANTTSGVSGFRAAGKYIDIVADQSIKNVLANATIKIYYTDAELAAAGITEGSLAVYYYNPATDAWENMGGVLGSDSNGKYISIVVNHFSLYGLFGSAPAPAMVSPVSSSSNSGGYTLTLSMAAPNEISVDAGTSKSFDVTVNANHLAVGTVLSASGVPQSWITITPGSADIAANGNQKYTIVLNVPAEQSGARTLTLTATSGDKSASKDVNIAINAAGTPVQPGATNTPAGTTAPAAGPTGLFLGVENTTWYGVIIGLAILGLLVYAFKKGKIRIGKTKYDYKK